MFWAQIIGTFEGQHLKTFIFSKNPIFVINLFITCIRHQLNAKTFWNVLKPKTYNLYFLCSLDVLHKNRQKTVFVITTTFFVFLPGHKILI